MDTTKDGEEWAPVIGGVLGPALLLSLGPVGHKAVVDAHKQLEQAHATFMKLQAKQKGVTIELKNDYLHLNCPSRASPCRTRARFSDIQTRQLLRRSVQQTALAAFWARAGAGARAVSEDKAEKKKNVEAAAEFFEVKGPRPRPCLAPPPPAPAAARREQLSVAAERATPPRPGRLRVQRGAARPPRGRLRQHDRRQGLRQALRPAQSGPAPHPNRHAARAATQLRQCVRAGLRDLSHCATGARAGARALQPHRS
jgi:hypothetical protein